MSGGDQVGSLWVEQRLAGRPRLALRGTTSRPLPAHVRDAVLDGLAEHGEMAPSRGLHALRDAIAALHDRDPEREVLVTNGAQHALSVCFRALLRPGDRVVVPSPAYSFGGLIERAGAEPVYVPSHERGGWRWDPDAIGRAVDGRTRMLVVCNPCNPTGYLPEPEVIDALVDLCARRGLVLLTDEAYERYVYDGAALASAAARSPEVVLVRSIGKSWALPGWRLGYVVAPPSRLDACARTLEWDCLRCPAVGQWAAAAAIAGPQEWLADVADEYRASRDAAYAHVQAARALSCTLPQAGPFLFLRLDGITPERLLAAGIPAVPGSFFQAPGHARVPIGGDAATLEALGDALAALG